jgi:hypothetical protein
MQAGRQGWTLFLLLLSCHAPDRQLPRDAQSLPASGQAHPVPGSASLNACPRGRAQSWTGNFDTLFGGHDETWATPVDTFADFAGFVVCR